MLSTTPQSVDVLIIGGGTAGCAAALALLQRDAGLTIAVVAASSFPRNRIGESLPPQSTALLRQLGVWDAFETDFHRPCPGFSSCWGDAEPGYIDFFTTVHGTGWSLDRSRFDHTLLNAVNAAGVHVDRDVKASGLTMRPDASLDVTCQSHSQRMLYKTRFLIDATGRKSWLARHIGTRQLRVDNLLMLSQRIPQSAVTENHAMTLVEAAEHGWWYSTDLPCGDKLIGLFTDSDIARRLALHQAKDWLCQLGNTRYTKNGLALSDIQKPAVSAAMSARPTRCCGKNWLAIGDAAATYDPLSAQGIHKALKDGISAAETVLSALENGSGEFVKDQEEKNTNRYHQYLLQRQQYYTAEQRWSHSDFWQRRQQPIRLP